ncbi:hypothetical protein F7725_012636 [Dissostichus mawsoni]|uniref:Uncharacterized protein n=1 Tax=Dissostichus mawsoni TaxID=36200 RepID=A0A7J5YMU1_DISMA|nr:hypothetical protein F7725_012636 [Dissostichus mawsoni]
MEGALTARDRVGIQDFVLLDETTETAFLSFSVGDLIALHPHSYALADSAYQTMLTEFNNHFILISGESGAGKTEASKKILQYYAVSCPSTTLLNTVRDKMLMSNPVLEAFGNAKTLKNDNSSRFGKYMDIQFDSQGDAVGGHILNYLLEKSRVVHQNHGERNFHIFYQLVEGGEDDLLQQMGLERDCQHYNYLTQGECAIVSSINDRNDWKTVKNALQIINIDEINTNHLFGTVASVLHLGNVQFDSDSKGHALLNNNNAELRWVSNVLSPFTTDHAIYARDALAKAIYGQTFTWLVNKINESMENKDNSRKTVIGLLDIYGFEVFYVNSFEQFCINYCNEKLQQLFIQLTLKAEQEEYEAEDIELIGQSKNAIVKECFSSTDPDSRRRPETVATQFKSSLLKLTEILMAKEAWYIRCLKSNESKQPGQFDEALIRHQVKYLGLMEHLRVRRAGFAYRRKYEVFLKRYKPLCPATWPHWRGVPADGVEVLVQHLGYMPNEYKMGRTKNSSAIRGHFMPQRMLMRDVNMNWVATSLQAKYKGYKAKGEFKKQKEAGYMNRGQLKNTDNSEYLAFVRQNYLNRLKGNLPKTVLDKTTWQTPPAVLAETSEILRLLHYRLMVRKYVRGITPQKKAQLQLKLLTSSIFKGKKESYPQSIAQPFVDTRISEQEINMRVLQTIRNEHIKYGVPVIKYDRNGFKPRPRQLVLTQTAAYVIEEAKIKQRVLYTSLKDISVSNLTDGIIVLHITCEDPKQKGDLLMQCDHLFEFLTKLCFIAHKQNSVKVVQGSIKIEIQAGKESAVDFSLGQEPMVFKAKNGHLMVVRPVLMMKSAPLPLGLGHGNMCGVEATHKKPLHISSGDP